MAEEQANADAKIVDFDAGATGWGETKITLARPFKFRGVVYQTIAVRTPSGRDVARFMAAPKRDMRDLVESLTEVDGDVLDAMHANDFSRLVAHVGEFLAGG